MLSAALAVGFGLRLRAVHSNNATEVPVGSDAWEYREMARSFNAGKGFRIGENHALTRSPGYPFVLAVFYRLAGTDSVPSVRYFNIVMGLLAIAAVFVAGWMAYSPIAGGLAALLLAINTSQIVFTPSLGIDAFYSLLLAATALSLLWWEKTPTAARAVVPAILISAGLTARSTLVLFPLLIIAFHYAKTRDLANTGHIAAVFLAATLAFTLPLALRNKNITGLFTPFEVAKTSILFEYGSRHVAGDKFMTEQEPAVTLMDSFPLPAWERTFYALGRRNIAQHPARYFHIFMQRPRLLWLEGHTPATDYAPPSSQSNKANAILLGLALAGMIVAIARHKASTTVLLLLYANIYLLLPSGSRYSKHFTPVLVILAGIGLCAVWTAIKQRNKTAIAAAMAGFLLIPVFYFGAPKNMPDKSVYPAKLPTCPDKATVRDPQTLYSSLRFEEAYCAFSSQIKSSPQEAAAYFNRAAARALLNDFPGEEADLTVFLSFRDVPEHIRRSALRRRAAARLTLGNNAGAVLDLKEAMKLCLPGSDDYLSLQNSLGIITGDNCQI